MYVCKLIFFSVFCLWSKNIFPTINILSYFRKCVFTENSESIVYSIKMYKYIYIQINIFARLIFIYVYTYFASPCGFSVIYGVCLNVCKKEYPKL